MSFDCDFKLLENTAHWITDYIYREYVDVAALYKIGVDQS